MNIKKACLTQTCFFAIISKREALRAQSSIRSINKLRYCGHFKPKIKSLAPSEAEIQDVPFYAILRHLYAIFRYVRHFLNCITSIINKHVYCSHFKPKIKYLAPSVAEIQYYMPFYAFFSNFHRFECVFLRCAATADCSVWLISSVMYYSVTYMYTCKIKILFTMILLKISPKITQKS